MSLNKPLEEVTEADLLKLIENTEAEDKGIDYKKALVLSADKVKEEFRADVTSFANALGGHLVIGMDEAGGFPIALVGQDIANVDAFKLQVDEVLQTKITPRIPGVGIHPIPLSNRKWAIVVRIPRSFAKPHQVTVNKDDYQFWARNSAGKYRMTVDELRSVIVHSDSLAERMRQFCTDKVGRVISGDTPFTLLPTAKILLHVIPFSAFDAGASINLSNINSNNLATLADPERQASIYGRFNLDGFIAFLKLNTASPSPSYTQVYRNGIIEFVDSFLFDPRQSGDHPEWTYEIEEKIVKSVRIALSLQTQLGVMPPFAIIVALIGVKECKIAVSQWHMMPVESFGHDIVSLPETLVMSPDEDLNKLVRPIFDAAWNAGGFSKCNHFDDNGVLKKPKEW